MKEVLEGKRHEAQLVWARVEQSSYHQEVLKVQQIKESIEGQHAILKEARETEKKAKMHLKEIEAKIEV